MPKSDGKRAMVATHAKRQGRGKLLEVMAWPREAPDVFHFVGDDEDRYAIGWRELTIHLPRDVFQAMVAAALVAPAVGQADGGA